MGLFSFLKRDGAATAGAPKKSAGKSGAKASAAEDVQVLRIRARRRLIAYHGWWRPAWSVSR